LVHFGEAIAELDYIVAVIMVQLKTIDLMEVTIIIVYLIQRAVASSRVCISISGDILRSRCGLLERREACS